MAKARAKRCRKPDGETVHRYATRLQARIASLASLGNAGAGASGPHFGR
jgi:hypothetical protein